MRRGKREISNLDKPKNIVKEIFERPKDAKNKVSSLFTHFKHPPETLLPEKAKIKTAPPLKRLPAAIDIGSSAIKLLQLAQGRADDKQEIVCIDKEAYPAGSSTLASQKEALHKIIERNKIGREVITAISVKDVQFYNLVFPPMSEAELNEAIRWKVTQLKPFGLNVEALIYKFIRWDDLFADSSAQQRVLLICTTKQLIQDRTSLLQEAGLEPIAIEIAPLSLINLSKLQKVTTTKNEVVLWLELGAEQSILIVARENNLYFCRSLVLAGQNLTRQIMRHCRLGEEQAEKLKREFGLSFWSPDKKIAAFLGPGELPPESKDDSLKVYHNIISAMESLIVDIEHSFKYFSYQISQSQITKFERIILSGGGAKLKNLDRFLNTKLATPVEKINPFLFFRLADSLRSQKKDLLLCPGEFAVCAGLAISEKIDKEKRINFLSGGRAEGKLLLANQLQKKSIQVAVLGFALVFLSVVAQISIAGFYKWKMRTFNQQIREAQKNLAQLQSTQLKLSQEEARLSERESKFKAKLRLLKAAMRKPDRFSDLLLEVANLLPEEIWVTKLSYEEQSVNITGAASDTNLVIKLINALKLSDNFADPSFSYSQKEPESGVYKFEVTAKLKSAKADLTKNDK